MPRKLGALEKKLMDQIRLNRDFARIGHKITSLLDSSGYKPADEKICQSALILGGTIYLYVSNLEELRIIRSMLEKLFPGYSDKLVSIYPKYWPDDYGEATWETSLRCVKICLNAPMENFPVELKPGCGFKKVARKIEARAAEETTFWEYSCQSQSEQ